MPWNLSSKSGLKTTSYNGERILVRSMRYNAFRSVIVCLDVFVDELVKVVQFPPGYIRPPDMFLHIDITVVDEDEVCWVLFSYLVGALLHIIREQISFEWR